jgi:hypothetical protein
MEFGDVHDFRCESHVTEYMTRLATKDEHNNKIIARNLNLPRKKGPSLTHCANHTYGGAKNKLGFG